MRKLKQMLYVACCLGMAFLFLYAKGNGFKQTSPVYKCLHSERGQYIHGRKNNIERKECGCMITMRPPPLITPAHGKY